MSVTDPISMCLAIALHRSKSKMDERFRTMLLSGVLLG